MGEPGDVSDSGGVSVSGHGDSETLIGEVGFQGKVEEGGEEAGGACNGEDIMVEVLGSDVFFDGVCSGDRGGNLNEEGGAGLEREGHRDNKVAGGGGADEDLAEREVGDLGGGGGEAWNPGSHSEVEGSLKVDRVVAQETQVVPAEKSVETVDEKDVGKDTVQENIDSFDGGVCVRNDLVSQKDEDVCKSEVVSPTEVVEVKSSNPVNKGGSTGVQAADALVKDHAPPIEDDSFVNNKFLDKEKQVGGALHVREDQLVCEAITAIEGHEDAAVKKVGAASNAASESCIKPVQTLGGDSSVNLDKVLISDTKSSKIGATDQAVSLTRDDWKAEKKLGSSMNNGIVHTDPESLNKGVGGTGEAALDELSIPSVGELKPTSVSGSTEHGGVKELQNKVQMIGTDASNYVDENPEPSNREIRETDNLDPEVEGKEQDTDIKHPKQVEEGLMSGSSGGVLQASYQLPAENEGDFSVSDLVWGKVRSHPWWPGQIFEPSDSSEKALKYHKKDTYLVAYFGDHSFAWNEASQLKHFRTHFSLIEKQSNSESFHNAVTCALEEVSRRIELGLACTCIPVDTFEKIKHQNVENAGIRKEASTRGGVDKSASADSFQPDKFLNYVKALAQSATGEVDHLELVIAKAQLLAFYHLKGYSHLPEYQLVGELVDNEVMEYRPPISDDGEQHLSVTEKMESQIRSSHKRKHNLRDIFYPSKKERSLSELMVVTMDPSNDENELDGKTYSKATSPSSSKKLKAFDSFDEDSAVQDSRKNVVSAHVSNTTSSSPRPSFKIGDCIRRVASQLTGSPSIMKHVHNQKFDGDGYDVPIQYEDPQGNNMANPAEFSSVNEILSQLHLVARDPMKGYSFLGTISNFFSDFRNKNLWVDKAGGGRKRKAFRSISGYPEAFEFEDMKDSYWTDRVIQNGSEEKSRKDRKVSYQPVVLQPQESTPRTSRIYTRKKFASGNNKVAGEKTSSTVDERKNDLSATELIMSFPDVDSIPSETKLNNMFRRFGPLKEFETEVDREANRARVVFKRCSDAEVAFSSAGKFNIFGSIVVHYQISYTPSVSYKAAPIAPTQHMELVTMQDLEFASTHDLEFVTMQELEDASLHDMHYVPTQDLEGATMQDLEFPTAHDLEFASVHHLDVATTHGLEIASLQVSGDATIQHMDEATPYSKVETGPDQQVATAQFSEDATMQGMEVDTQYPKAEMKQAQEIAETQLSEDATMQDMDVATHYRKAETVLDGEIATTQASVDMAMQDVDAASQYSKAETEQDLETVPQNIRGDIMQDPGATTVRNSGVMPQDPTIMTSQDVQVTDEHVGAETREDSKVPNEGLGVEAKQDLLVNEDPGVEIRESLEDADENLGVENMEEPKVDNENLELDTMEDPEVAATRDPEVATKLDSEVTANQDPEVGTEQDPTVATERDPEIARGQDPEVARSQDPEVPNLDIKDANAQVPEDCNEDLGPKNTMEPAGPKLQELEVADVNTKIAAVTTEDSEVVGVQEPVVTMQDPEISTEVEEVSRAEDPEDLMPDHVIVTNQEADVATAQDIESARTPDLETLMQVQEVAMTEDPEDAT